MLKNYSYTGSCAAQLTILNWFSIRRDPKARAIRSVLHVTRTLPLTMSPAVWVATNALIPNVRIQ